MQRSLHDLKVLCAQYAARHGLFDGLPPAAAERKAEVIATFLYLCAPASPEPHAQRLALELTTYFFYVDDLPPARILAAIPGLWRHPALMETIAAIPSDAAREQFAPTLQWLIDGFEDEAALRNQNRPLTLIEYERIRPKVVFVDTYVGIWLAGADSVLRADERDTAARMLPPAREVVFLVNDLASVDRDAAAAHPDPNLVLMTRDDRRITLDDAIAVVIARHDAAMDRLEDAMARATSPGLQRFAAAVRGTVVGNWETHVQLAGNRYGREAAILRQVRALKPV